MVPPLGRLVEPAEVAALTRFLLDPTGTMITGQTFVICGGASADVRGSVGLVGLEPTTGGFQSPGLYPLS